MLIATDLDGSLALGEKEDILKMFSLFNKHDINVVYATGRDLHKFRELSRIFCKEQDIKFFLPDYLVTLNGAKIYKLKKSRLMPLKNFWRDRQWEKIAKKGWNKKAAIEAINITSKKVRFFSDLPALVDVKYKPGPLHLELTVYHNKLDQIKECIEEECRKKNTKVNVIYDYIEKHHVDLGLKILDAIDKKKANIIRKMTDEKGGVYVSMVSATNKGEAVDYIRKKYRLKKSQTIAAGDGGNDLELLTQGFKSIVVNNAHPLILRKPLENLPEKEKSNLIFVPSNGVKGMLEGMDIILNNTLPHCCDSSLGSVINA